MNDRFSWATSQLTLEIFDPIAHVDCCTTTTCILKIEFGRHVFSLIIQKFVTQRLNRIRNEIGSLINQQQPACSRLKSTIFDDDGTLDLLELILGHFDLIQ